jgi:ribosome biogenesis GTPase A
MLLHPINDDLIHIRLPSLTKKFDENKIKEADGCIVLNKIDLLQRAQKYTKIIFFFSFYIYIYLI